MTSAPRVTFPARVHDAVAQEYCNADVILEYGSGGSTGLAARSADLTFSVETDADWIRRMDTWLAAEGLRSRVILHHADIGPTKRWGHPEKYRLRHLGRYLDYPRTVWRRPDFREPDVILIDGRFRLSCFLWVMENISKTTRVLFDDYGSKPRYHSVERFQKPAVFVDRMAIFDLEPKKLSEYEKIKALPLRLDNR